MRFADTSVLLNAISTDSREEGKASGAGAVLEHRDIVLSAQVLQKVWIQAIGSGGD